MNIAIAQKRRINFQELFQPHSVVAMKFLKTLPDTVIIDSITFRRNGDFFLSGWLGSDEKYYLQFRVEGYDSQRLAIEQSRAIIAGHAKREIIFEKDVIENSRKERAAREVAERSAFIHLHGGYDDEKYYIGTSGT